MDRYEEFKRFFQIYTETMLDLSSCPEEDRPMNVLARFEKQSPAIGRKSLRLGLADVICDLEHAPPDKLAAFSARLAAAGAPSITSVRASFSRKLESMLDAFEFSAK
jgi:hypothetical protein